MSDRKRGLKLRRPNTTLRDEAAADKERKKDKRKKTEAEDEEDKPPPGATGEKKAARRDRLRRRPFTLKEESPPPYEAPPCQDEPKSDENTSSSGLDENVGVRSDRRPSLQRQRARPRSGGGGYAADKAEAPPELKTSMGSRCLLCQKFIDDSHLGSKEHRNAMKWWYDLSVKGPLGLSGGDAEQGKNSIGRGKGANEGDTGTTWRRIWEHREKDPRCRMQ